MIEEEEEDYYDDDETWLCYLFLLNNNKFTSLIFSSTGHWEISLSTVKRLLVVKVWEVQIKGLTYSDLVDNFVWQRRLEVRKTYSVTDISLTKIFFRIEMMILMIE